MVLFYALWMLGLKTYSRKLTWDERVYAHQLAYFTKRTRTRDGPWEKADHGSLEHADAMPKFTIWIKTHFRKIWGCWFQIWQQFLKFVAQKYPNKAFFLPIWAFSFFQKTLQLGQFEGADFKYDKIVFKLQSKNTQIIHFLVPSLGTFIFYKILKLDKFKGADFKYDNIIFKFQSKNTQIGHF